MKTRALVLSIACLAALPGCSAPNTFVRTLEPTWASVELRDDLEYDRAWGAVVDTLIRRFDVEVISKEDGYVRTNWLYTWTGQLMENYRVRVTAKFSPDRKKCDIKSEAEYGGAGKWVAGYDERLLSTIKTDIMGAIGRTTR
jgi:hypothetical protein